jgi:hypothetical protein
MSRSTVTTSQEDAQTDPTKHANARHFKAELCRLDEQHAACRVPPNLTAWLVQVDQLPKPYINISYGTTGNEVSQEIRLHTPATGVMDQSRAVTSDKVPDDVLHMGAWAYSTSPKG